MKTAKEILSQYISDLMPNEPPDNLSDIYEAMEEYASQFTSPIDKWVSVEERLPDDSEWYLGFIVDSNKLNFQRGVMNVFLDSNRIDSVVWLTESGDIRVSETVTHWQPLPNPPTK